MDENDSARGHQFHGNEAISAVVDEGFLAEEEEDDYEDLYNDVNVGENFLNSLRKNEDDNSKIGQVKEELDMPLNKADFGKPEVVEGVNVNSHQEEVVDRVEGYQNVNAVDTGRGTTSTPSSVGGGGGFRVELTKTGNLGDKNVVATIPSTQQVVQYQQNQQPAVAADAGNVGSIGNVYGGNNGAGGGGGTFLFVGDLHWWTTDADLESELCKYGPVKELKFFDERASGKSKGYCQVEFYDPAAAMACKEGMNGHVFNGRACVVAYASPYNVKRMGEAQINRNQQQMGQGASNQPRRGPGDLPNRPGGAVGGMPTGGVNQGGMESNGRGFGRGNWGRGGAPGGLGIRGQSGPLRNRGGGPMGPRGMAGNGFGQAMGGVPPLLPPQSMMGQGFDPAFGGPMGRMGGYGGFPGAPAAPYPGLLTSFGPVGNVGLPGVAPHVNPAFFGRGMPMGGMGMMPNAGPGVDGSNMGMWSDPNMGGWSGDDNGARAGESSYGEEAASDHQYEEASQERGGPWPNAMEKDRASERDVSGSSDRRYRDDRGQGYDRDIPREKDMGRDPEYVERRQRDDKDAGRDRDKERSRDRERSVDRDRDRERRRDDRDRRADQRKYRSRDAEYDDERDRGRSSRTYSKSRHEERRSRSRDADYGKRRRMTSD